ncbi:uncharacterized protein [Periplaneta americana]|uniref:uncharacterized protein n=1 Tax=Periplaneta americana TaxID=6978 RepID=UPI0037E809A6
MGRASAIVLLLCVLACVWANPIAKDDSVATPDVVASTTQDQDVKEMLTEAGSKEEASVDVKPATPDKPDAVPETTPSREARNFDAGNQANEIVGNGQQADQENTLLQKLNSKCSKRDVSSCVMLKLVSYMNRLLKKSNIEVLEGLHITQTTSEVQVEEETPPLDHPRALGDEEEDEETLVSQLLADKVWTFVRTRSLRWSVLPDADVVMSTSPDEQGTLNVGMSIRTGKALEKGRGKMKQMGPLMAAAAMKFALLGGLALKGLALLVGKALLVSKIALLLAGILWLKKLFSHQKHVTYEVVAHPHHSHSSGDHHDSYSSGWGRSSDIQTAAAATAAHQLAYSAYAPEAASH